jgi:hypothetical protein
MLRWLSCRLLVRRCDGDLDLFPPAGLPLDLVALLRCRESGAFLR